MTGGSHHDLSIAAVDPGVFGDHQQYAEQNTQAGTTSGTYAQFMSLATPVIPAGTYRVGVVFQYEGSTGSTVGQYRLQLDNVTDVDDEILDVASAGEQKTYSNFRDIVLAAGAHTFDFDFRVNGGSGTFSVDDGHLEIWRVA